MNRIQKLISTLLITTMPLTAGALKAPHSIVLTFNEYPYMEDTQALKAGNAVITVVDAKLKGSAYHKFGREHPSKKYRCKKPIDLFGIPIIYSGYMTYTTKGGIVMLPRMHDDAEIPILICMQIKPIFMIRNTVHHLEIVKDCPHAFYKIIKKYDDQTKTHFWHVEKAELEKNGSIPVETIIIFMNPQDLYLPEGISISNDNAQSILPVVYVKSDKNHNANSLASLEINYLFKAINPIKKL